MRRLLSDKDLDQIRRAQEQGRIGPVLERELVGAGGVSVHIRRSGEAWGQPCIIELREWAPGMQSRQFFSSVTELHHRAARSCPVCGADSEVYNSRPRKDGTIERRRRCQVCGASFATREVFERFLDRRIDYGD